MPHMASEGSTSTSPYVEIARSDWAELAHATPVPLSERVLTTMRSSSDPIDLNEVTEVYLPLTRLISLYVEHAGRLAGASNEFLGMDRRRTPFVIGIAGSVAVGKTTTARVLQALLARDPRHPKVELVTTDGFLWPNAELDRRGIMHRKGFPESYDRRSLLRFIIGVKSGRPVTHAPVYSHLTYDRVADETITVERPDILIVEGLNVLQPAQPRADGTTGLAVSDFFDFSVYVDAATVDIKRWYIERFHRLRVTAFRDPRSYFRRYADLNDEQAHQRASEIWDNINGPNLATNVLPTRGRATAILRKGENHEVKWVRIRKM